MLPEPIGERVLSDISRGEREHDRGSLDLVSRKIETVQTKKNISGQKRGALISIDKGMIADNPSRKRRARRIERHE
jgi:hypothetical protein